MKFSVFVNFSEASWQYGLADINSKAAFLTITATVGNGYRGDIAIDDITISRSERVTGW